MSLTRYRLKGLALNLIATPAPTTLADSTAILRKLRTFGPVTTFRKLPRTNANGSQNKASQVYRVLSSDEATVRRAIEASPIVVSVNENVPDPREFDPYDIQGLQLRKQPQAQTFVCELTEDEDPSYHIDVVRQNPLHSSFKSSSLSYPQVYQELVEAGAPFAVAGGLAVSAHDLNPRNNNKNEESASRTVRSTPAPSVDQEGFFEYPTSSDAVSPGLMAMYRQGLTSRPPAISKPPSHIIPRPKRRKNLKLFKQFRAKFDAARGYGPDIQTQRGTES